MRIRFLLTLFVGIALSFSEISAQSEADTSVVFDELTAWLHYADSMNATFTWIHDQVELNEGTATLTIPPGYKFLDAEQSAYVLTELWGNPPQESLGLLFKTESQPLDTLGGFVVEISWEGEGYVSDDDAEDLDYDELLQTMIEETEAANEQRAALGYEGVHLLGWASTPFYDKAAKKLHWAKELQFDGQDWTTLNYNIRILGRKGYMVMNAIGTMEDLPAFQADADKILASMNFNDGNRYADFDSNLDEVAAVGIGGLIAGKVLLKAGLLAKLGLFLAKFWKVIALAVVGLGAGIKKFFFKGKKEEEIAKNT